MPVKLSHLLNVTNENTCISKLVLESNLFVWKHIGLEGPNIYMTKRLASAHASIESFIVSAVVLVYR